MRDERLYLDDLVSTGKLIQDRLKGVSRAEFDADLHLRTSVAHWLMIMGEAASKVSTSTRASFPSVPWSDIVAMRNIIVHEYFRVEMNIIYLVHGHA